VGANPKIVRNLGVKGKQFVKFEKQLFKDTKAKTQGTKQRSKQKQVQTEKKAKVSKKELKDAIKKASDTELKDWMQKANKELDLIKDPLERQLAKQRLAATVLEAKTGVAIVDESGNILLGQLEKALTKAGVRTQPTARFPSQVRARIPPLETKAPALGVIEGKIPTGILVPPLPKKRLLCPSPPSPKERLQIVDMFPCISISSACKSKCPLSSEEIKSVSLKYAWSIS
ncbi:unnamed protein product, partial [marine sediment metagenome]